MPRSPEEALAYMADLDPDGPDIPLYAQDGVTVIGSFHIGPGRVFDLRVHPRPHDRLS